MRWRGCGSKPAGCVKFRRCSRDFDDLPGVDQIWIGDLRIRRFQGPQTDPEPIGNAAEGVPRLDDVVSTAIGSDGTSVATDTCDRAPQLPLCAVDLNEHLILAPFVARRASRRRSWFAYCCPKRSHQARTIS